MYERTFAARINGLNVTITRVSLEKREDAWAVRAGACTLGILCVPGCAGPQTISPMCALRLGRAAGQLLLVRGRLAAYEYDGFVRVFDVTNVTTTLTDLRDISEVRNWIVEDILDALMTFAHPSMSYNDLFDRGVVLPASMAHLNPNGREFELAVERFRRQPVA